MTKNIQELIGVITSRAFTEEEKIEQIGTILDGNPELINIKNENSEISLSTAIKEGQLETAKFLLEHGADVNSECGVALATPLHIAAFIGNEEMTKLLIDKDAEIDAVNFFSRTALYLAIENDKLGTVKLLIENYANINLQDEDGKTPLHIAVIKNRVKTVKLLLESGANIESKDYCGNMPLHKASSEGYDAVVKLLLEYGANINYQGSYNDTALHKAIENEHREIAKYLIDTEGINVNLQNKEGKTPLHLAVLYRDSEIVRLLIEKNSSLNTQDKFGETALHIAVRRNDCPEIAEFLIRYTLLQDNKAGKPNDLGRYSAYWDKCHDEIEEMQKHKIGNSEVSFYEIPIAKGKELESYVNNDNIVKVLDTYDYKGTFPIYADEIKNQYKKGMNEKVAADIILNFDENVLNEYTSRMILDCLDYRVIRNLCIAGYRELVENKQREKSKEKQNTNTEVANQQSMEYDNTVSDCFSCIRVKEHGKEHDSDKCVIL